MTRKTCSRENACNKKFRNDQWSRFLNLSWLVLFQSTFAKYFSLIPVALLSCVRTILELFASYRLYHILPYTCVVSPNGSYVTWKEQLLTECCGRCVVVTLAYYSGGPGFKSWAGEWLSWQGFRCFPHFEQATTVRPPRSQAGSRILVSIIRDCAGVVVHERAYLLASFGQ
jgi:hypothetical protein